MPAKGTKKATKKSTTVEPLVPKKRGRKPKGGKIITVTETVEKNNSYSSNVIVHLKCKKSDLDQETLSMSSNNVNNANNINNANNANNPNNVYNAHNMYNANNAHNAHDVNNNNINNISPNECQYHPVIHKKDSDNVKTIHEKLKELQKNLHNNTICDTDSACFWCTYNFSNLPIAIPKFEINNTYHVYGCFCSPECAAAYLMNETINSSVKFERYHLLCYLYSKVFNYENNITPAPNPHYTLKKFFGNLSIEEYRELLKSQRHLFIIDKPITRELPEIHEEYNNYSKFSYANKTPGIFQTFNS